MSDGIKQSINWTALVAAVVSLGSAGVSTWFAERARQQEEELKKIELSQDYQIKVFDEVTETLAAERASRARLTAACALVLTLPDDPTNPRELRDNLVSILLETSNETDAVCPNLAALEEANRDAALFADETSPAAPGAAAAPAAPVQDVVASAATEPEPVAAAPAPPEPIAGATPAPAPSRNVIAGAPAFQQLPPPQVQQRQLQLEPGAVLQQGRAALGLPSGWDIDVFWCAGDASAESRGRAERAFEALAQAAQTETEIAPGVRLGRVRLRELAEAINARKGYAISGDVLRVEDREADAGAALMNFLSTSGAATMTPTGVASRTPWYMSLFFCPGQAP